MKTKDFSQTLHSRVINVSALAAGDDSVPDDAARLGFEAWLRVNVDSLTDAFGESGAADWDMWVRDRYRNETGKEPPPPAPKAS